MRKAIRPARFKAGTDDLDEGQFEALVAVFGNVDYGGDRILPGAFADSIKAWADSGDPIPVIWSHRWEDPEYHIGEVLTATENGKGLLVRGQLDMGMAKAETTFRLLKGRRVKQFSFAYDVDEEREAENDRANELVRLSVHEVGPTLLGMNPDTELLEVKSAADVRRLLARAQQAIDRAKGGGVLSASNTSLLLEAHERIGGVLVKLDERDPADVAGQADALADLPDPLALRTMIELEEAGV